MAINITGNRTSSNGIVRGYVAPGTVKVNGVALSSVARSYQFNLPDHQGGGTRQVKLTKISADENGEFNKYNNISLKSYTETIEDKLRYPNSAYFYLTFNAEPFGGRIPSRAYHLRLLQIKVPTNYDPHTRAYSGLWDGSFKIAWTNNPAWVFYDLATNSRYGLGDYIDNTLIDKWSLYTIAKYCDEAVDSGFGFKEPRFTCNVYFQTRAEAYTVLQNLASVFRGMTYWNNSQLVCVQDSDKSPVAMFSNSNVIDGIFTYSGTGVKARHTVALVTWNDPEDFYKSKVEYVADNAAINKYGIRQLDVVATGCTSRGQAHRLGRWMLFTESLETEVVTFSASLDNIGLEPGNIISVLDTNRSGVRYSGRIKAATSNTITFDSIINLNSGVTYTINTVLPEGQILTLPDGNTKVSSLAQLFEDTFTVPSSGDYSTVTLDTGFTTLPLINSLWGISEANLIPQEFKVISIVETDKNLFQLTCLEHNNSKFGFIESNLNLVFEPHSNIRYSPESITTISINESLALRADKSIRTDLTISWDSAKNAQYYIIDYKHIDSEANPTNWQRISNNHPGTLIDLQDVVDGDNYLFRVYAVNDIGGVSEYYETPTQYTVLGKTIPPEDVTGFAADLQIYSIRFYWDAIADLDASHYEIREGTVWSSGTVVAKNITQLEHTITQKVSGTYNYMIKAVDTTGNESTNITNLQVVVPNPPNVSNFSILIRDTDILLSWDHVNISNLSGYEIRKGNDWNTGVKVSELLKDNNLVQPLSTSIGTTYYTIKAIDSAGNYSTDVGLVSYSTSLPTSPTSFSITRRRTNMLLSWDALPFHTYEIRKGTSWGGATVLVSNYSGSSFIVDEEFSGTYYYLIKSKDYVGNESTAPSSTNITLVAPSKVTNFVVVQSGDRTEMSWDPNPASEYVYEYEIRQGSSWASSIFIQRTSATTHTIRSAFSNNTLTYLIKSIGSPGVYANNAVSYAATDYVASPTVGNLIYSQTEDSAWAGNRLNLEIFDTTKLKQTNGSGSTAEYIFEVDISQNDLARNSIDFTPDIVLADTDTWANTTWAWNSTEANRSWLVSGADSSAVTFIPQISRDIGLNVNDIEGFSLNSTTTGYGSTAAATATGVAYDWSRTNKGLLLDTVAGTTVRWVVSTPSEFSLKFWIKMVDIYDETYVRLYNTSTLKYLLVRYDSTGNQFILEDDLANQIVVSYTAAANDIVLLAIDQTTTTRTLHIGKLYGSRVSSSNSFTPIGTFDELRLY